MHTRTGFIGLDQMGKPMALNLARAGFPLTVLQGSSRPARQAAVRLLAEQSAAVVDGFMD